LTEVPNELIHIFGQNALEQRAEKMGKMDIDGQLNPLFLETTKSRQNTGSNWGEKNTWLVSINLQIWTSYIHLFVIIDPDTHGIFADTQTGCHV